MLIDINLTVIYTVLVFVSHVGGITETYAV